VALAILRYMAPVMGLVHILGAVTLVSLITYMHQRIRHRSAHAGM
jgi:hypothetical protein